MLNSQSALPEKFINHFFGGISVINFAFFRNFAYTKPWHK